MKVNPERHQEILKAIFIHFVKKDLMEKNLIRRSTGTSITELVSMAKLLNCDSQSLHVAIEAAVDKINNSQSSVQRLDYVTEASQTTEVMISAVKYKLKNSCTRLFDLQRELGNLAEQLNEEDNELDLMDNELSKFIYPIYLEATKETFEQLELIPHF